MLGEKGSIRVPTIGLLSERRVRPSGDFEFLDSGAVEKLGNESREDP
jgi:hypothetical protein